MCSRCVCLCRFVVDAFLFAFVLSAALLVKLLCEAVVSRCVFVFFCGV